MILLKEWFKGPFCSWWVMTYEVITRAVPMYLVLIEENGEEKKREQGPIAIDGS
uniref:Uncharacterized protein n=1 Tax=Rhizophora mucronata TaxID=61149 RepID=A0A2P2NJW1_RHIMU